MGVLGAAPCEILDYHLNGTILMMLMGRYAVYFVVLLLCGDWTLLNVFLAIACDSLDQVTIVTILAAVKIAIRLG